MSFADFQSNVFCNHFLYDKTYGNNTPLGTHTHPGSHYPLSKVLKSNNVI